MQTGQHVLALLTMANRDNSVRNHCHEDEYNIYCWFVLGAIIIHPSTNWGVVINNSSVFRDFCTGQQDGGIKKVPFLFDTGERHRKTAFFHSSINLTNTVFRDFAPLGTQEWPKFAYLAPPCKMTVFEVSSMTTGKTGVDPKSSSQAKNPTWFMTTPQLTKYPSKPSDDRC